MPFVGLPVPALAPTIQTAGGRIEGRRRPPVRRPAGDPEAVRRHHKDSPEYGAPQADPFAYPKVLAGFIPPADEGTITNPNFQTLYKASQLPSGLLRFDFVPGLMDNPANPNDLGSPEGVQALRVEAVNRIGWQLLTDPSPRERVQRGQADAVRQLVALRDDYQKAQQRVRSDRDRDAMMQDWVKSARDGSRRIAAARDRNPAALTAAEGQFQQFLKETTRAVSAIADLAVAEVGLGEATYQIALTKHEQAVREQGRLDRQPGADRRKVADAWAEARDWWQRYEQYADVHERAYPGRKAQAKRLAADAAGFGS